MSDAFEENDHIYKQPPAETGSSTKDPASILSARPKAPSHGMLAPLLHNLPFLAMLAMAVVGIALSTLGAESLNFYWEIITPIYCCLCIASGWSHVDPEDRIGLIWTQILHWLAFLVAMYLISAPQIRVVQGNTGAGIDQMATLALGTFVAGIHARAWRIALVGATLAAAIPALAWVQRSALLLILVLGFIAVVALIWARHKMRAAPAA